MKKSTKTALRLMIVVGFMVCGTVTLSGSPQGERIQERVIDRVDSQLSISDSTRISIDVSRSDVSIGLSPDDEVHITYSNTNLRTYEIKQNDEKLELTLEYQENDWSTSNMYWETIDVTVLIPAQLNGSLSVNNSRGYIEAKHISSQRHITLQNSRGSINLEQIVCVNIALNCSRGSIKFSELDAQEIVLASIRGNIRGNIVGNESEFTITSTVSRGSNNLPLQWGKGSKLLDVRASRGGIDISFTE